MCSSRIRKGDDGSFYIFVRLDDQGWVRVCNSGYPTYIEADRDRCRMSQQQMRLVVEGEL